MRPEYSSKNMHNIAAAGNTGSCAVIARSQALLVVYSGHRTLFNVKKQVCQPAGLQLCHRELCCLINSSP